MYKVKNLILVAIFISSAVFADGEYSYLWAHQYPALADPPIVCCFDFVDGPEDDDLNGAILLSLEGLLMFDSQASMDDRIIENELVRIWRWDTLPDGDGPIQMSILQAELNNPLLNLTDRMAGLTQVKINPSALSVFTGSMTDNNFIMTSDSSIGVFYNSVIGFTSLSQSSFDIEVPLNQVRISGSLEIDESGCQGVCSGTISANNPLTLGAIEVSGLLHVGDEINTINQITSTCFCAGIDPETPLLTYQDSPSSLTISCQYNSGELTPENCGSEFEQCQNIDQQCSFAALLVNYYDVDTNKNGTVDSKSVGGLMGIAGATVTGLFDLIYENGFE